MKSFLSILTIIASSFAFSQATPPVTVCLGDPATICPGQTVEITNCTPGTGGPALGSIVMSNPASVNLSDDQWSGSVPIGFPFSFYGNTYSNLLIGSNGLLSFITANAGGYCSWSLSGTTLPTTSYAAALNSIMLTYQDINPSIPGASIQYQTIGTAPNRMFVVLYANAYFYSCTSVCNYMGVVLFEGTNEIEMHIGNKPTCAFNGSRAVQGVQNAAGTSAVITPGRNSTVWTANQDARKFSPLSATNTSDYTVSVIPYNQISGTGGVTSWVNTAGQSFPYNGGVLNVTNPPAGTTGYFLSGTACGAALGSISDTTFITTSAVGGSITKTPDFCSTSSGTATVTPTGAGPFTYLWGPTGQTTQTATGLSAGVNTVTIRNADGCEKFLSTIIYNNSITTSGTSTKVSCPGGNDGTATAAVTPPTPATTYNWFEDGGQTTATATGLAAGVHRVEIISGAGCIDTLSIAVTELPGMVATIDAQTDVTCNSGSDGTATIGVTLGTAPYSFSWDRSASTTNTATDLSVGSHVVTITDDKNCVITTTITLGQPDQLKFVDLTPDLITCVEDSATISATAVGGSSAYTYTWTQGATVVGIGQTIKVKVPTSGTQYCVRITEACGSPAADTCMMITFPVDLIPSIVPDMDAKCEPAMFTFTNLTNDPGEIFSTRFTFGNDQPDSTVAGNASVTMDYPEPRSYDVDLLVTSIHGCVYEKTFPAIVRTIKKPKASFTTSANPATVFETTIQMQNNSSQSVVDWQWYAPGGSPSTSNIANPTIKFPEGEIGQYPVRLIVETAEGCIDTVTTVIHIVSDIIFFAPNAFTPDGNEFNQTWKVVTEGIDIYDFEVRIFNRWGEQVWESHNPAEGWDGTFNGEILKEGAYVFVAKVKDLHSDAYKTFKGHITLLR